ncbi:MAG: hypothetical protein ACPL6D_08920 [Thermodesulfobacteriota bacterium]
MNLKPFLPIGIGSLPYSDPFRASEAILNHFPESPYWPQLPLRDWREEMLYQFTEGMPGFVRDGERVYFHPPFDPPLEWERFYEMSQSGDLEGFKIGQDYASGFHAMLKLLEGRKPLLLKGQITGPITLGLGLCDEKKIPILYDPNLKEMMLKVLGHRARWQEKEFQRIIPEAKTLIFFDEPLLSSYGSISMNLSKREIIDCLESVSSFLNGLSGIHICGATDWSIVTETRINVIHFDAYRYFSNMLVYAPELKRFLHQGGMLGWGIVPSEEDSLKVESTSNLLSSLVEKIDLLVKEGIPREIILKNSLISQSCGLASVSVDLAEKALRLTQELSLEMKKKWAMQ